MVKISENINTAMLQNIRRQWMPEEGKMYFSVVDIIEIITDSADPRNYWKVLKNRLKNTQNELVTRINQLKMPASDGKLYLTDVAGQGVMLEIIKLVSPANVSTFKMWFGRLKNEQNESYPQTTGAEMREEELMPLIDAYREKNNFIIQTFLAGLNMENIFVSATCNTVIISGEREVKKYIRDENYQEQELSWGKFSRTIELQEEIEIDEVTATEHHGLVTITLPVIDKDRSRIIKVKTI